MFKQKKTDSDAREGEPQGAAAEEEALSEALTVAQQREPVWLPVREAAGGLQGEGKAEDKRKQQPQELPPNPDAPPRPARGRTTNPRPATDLVVLILLAQRAIRSALHQRHMEWIERMEIQDEASQPTEDEADEGKRLVFNQV